MAYDRIFQRDGKRFMKFPCHPECTEALDQARFHSEEWWFIPNGQQDRGEYPCPFDNDGDGDCAICCNTPFRRLARGDDKPALQKLADWDAGPRAFLADDFQKVGPRQFAAADRLTITQAIKKGFM